jgi:hydroxyacylglutathione hydrolase
LIVRCLPVGPLQANCYLVGCLRKREIAIVDPGGEANRILAEVAASGFHVKYIINTHGHSDHIAANQPVREATGAELLIHALDADMLTNPSRNLSLLTGGRLECQPPDQLLAAHDELELGEVTLKVLHTPGHTPGSICLLSSGVVLTGDTLFAGGIGRTDFPGGSFKQLIRSIRDQLLVLDDSTEVYPGHGPASTIGAERYGNPFL